jgi:hypothetical protein
MHFSKKMHIDGEGQAQVGGDLAVVREALQAPSSAAVDQMRGVLGERRPVRALTWCDDAAEWRR